MKIEFSRQIFENPYILHFLKILPVRGELFHTDGQTDMTKLIIAFHNFSKDPNNGWTKFKAHLLHQQRDIIHSRDAKSLLKHLPKVDRRFTSASKKKILPLEISELLTQS